jgi:hypothetical protein
VQDIIEESKKEEDENTELNSKSKKKGRDEKNTGFKLPETKWSNDIQANLLSQPQGLEIFSKFAHDQ